MIHIPKAIYHKIANYVEENGFVDEETANYTVWLCNISDEAFEYENLVVDVDGWVSVRYRKEVTRWGSVQSGIGVDSSLVVTFRSDDDNIIPTDFDKSILHNYLINK